MKREESCDKLREVIDKAMEDLEITTTEFNAILAAAGEDCFEDHKERALLGQFQTMIGDGLIKRVPG